jgi:hypothetical protein
MKRRLLVVASGFLSVACPAAPTSEQFESKFQEALPLCEQLALPNSMARQPSFDLNKHQKGIEAELRKRAEFFRSNEGSRFLVNRSNVEQDSVAKLCAQKLLNASSG